MQGIIELEQFSGPFSLLLSLLEEEKLSINKLSLSKVTEQYLRYLDTLEEKKAEELADFLVVATRLLLLKAKTLLPQFAPEEEEEKSLEEQLRLYKAFVKASRQVNKKWMNEIQAFFRREPIHVSEGFVPPENVTLHSIERCMKLIIHRLKPLKPLPKTTIDRGVSLKEKIDSIRQLLIMHEKCVFQEVIADKQNKTEIIVGFLALLELVKQKVILLEQSDVFSDIIIKRV